LPVYLRTFYYRQLVSQKKDEKAQMDKANKGQSTNSKPKVPSFAKPPAK